MQMQCVLSKPDMVRKYSLRSFKQCFFASLLDNASPGKRFWGYVKSKSSQTSIPDLVSYKNVSANTPVDIANLFGCFFLNVLTGMMYLTLWFLTTMLPLPYPTLLVIQLMLSSWFASWITILLLGSTVLLA